MFDEDDARSEWERFWQRKRDRIVMVVAASDWERPGLGERLLRLRLHNRYVAHLVGERAVAESPAPAVVEKYLDSGVLASSDPSDAARMIGLAARVMRTFHTGDAAKWEISPKIGITRGKVVDLAPDPAGDGEPSRHPRDLQGEAVERALRLVEEVAEPGQILVEGSLVTAVAIGDIRQAAGRRDDATLRFEPCKPRQKAMVRYPNAVELSQLVWRGGGPPITNRWRYRQDVNVLHEAALTILTDVAEELDGDHRATFYDNPVEAAKIADFRVKLQRRKREIEQLKNAWEGTAEARHVASLTAATTGVLDAYQAVQNATANVRGDAGAVHTAISQVHEEWTVFRMAVNLLLEECQRAVRESGLIHA